MVPSDLIDERTQMGNSNIYYHESDLISTEERMAILNW